MKTYAILNSKGGVGKTTVSVNLGHGLALDGYKVLIVDSDIQDNIAVWLNVKPNNTTLFEVLTEDKLVSEAIINAREGLDILPSGADYLGAVPYLFRKENKPVSSLKKSLEEVANNYDYCIIDCSPSRSLIHTVAIYASDGIIVPINMEWLSVYGSAQVKKALDQVIDKYDIDVEIELVIPTFLDRRRSRACDDILDSLKKHFKDRLSSPIRINSRISEAPGYGETVYELGDKRAIEDFDDIKERVIEID
ncbi:MAG: ParA family protein [Halanaerobiales bacterium]